MASDRRYLRQKRNTWFFQYRLPQCLRDSFRGVEVLNESLGTTDLAEARVRRDIRLGELRQLEAQRSENPERYRFERDLKAIEDFRAFDSGDRKDPPSAPWMTDTGDGDEKAVALLHSLGKVDGHKVYGAMLREAMKAHLKSAHYAPSTESKTRLAVNEFLKVAGRSDIRLQKITRQLVKDFVDVLLARPLSRQTVTNYLGQLSAVWSYAETEELVSQANPFTRHRLKAKEGVRSHDLFSASELEALFAATAGESGAKYLLPRLGLYTGARLDELASLAVSDVFTERGVLCIQIRKGKNKNAQRDIPLHSAIAEDVKRQRDQAKSAEAQYLFPEVANIVRKDGKKGPYFSQWFSRLRDELFPDDTLKRSFHSLRACFATGLGRIDVSEQDAAWLCGWERGKTTGNKVYNRGKRMVELKAILERL